MSHLSPLKYVVFVKPMLNMIFGGVFERNPKLKFISAENEAGWATHILDRADFEWLRYQNVAVKDFEGRIPEKPSAYFKRNITLTFLRATFAIRPHYPLGTDDGTSDVQGKS